MNITHDAHIPMRSAQHYVAILFKSEDTDYAVEFLDIYGDLHVTGKTIPEVMAASFEQLTAYLAKKKAAGESVRPPAKLDETSTVLSSIFNADDRFVMSFFVPVFTDEADIKTVVSEKYTEEFTLLKHLGLLERRMIAVYQRLDKIATDEAKRMSEDAKQTLKYLDGILKRYTS